MNTYDGVQIKLHALLACDTRWRYDDQFHAPATLAEEIISRYPVNMKLNGPHGLTLWRK
jgi:hypothetical protein